MEDIYYGNSRGCEDSNNNFVEYYHIKKSMFINTNVYYCVLQCPESGAVGGH